MADGIETTTSAPVKHADTGMRRRASDSHRRDRLRGIIERLPDGIVVVDAVGNIRFADYAVDLAKFALDTTMGYETVLLSPRDFLTRHGQRLTVINGIDTSTNNHEAGTRATGAEGPTSRSPFRDLPGPSGLLAFAS